MARAGDMPAYDALRDKLADLRERVDAENVVVCDQSNNLWCVALPYADGTADADHAEPLLGVALKKREGGVGSNVSMVSPVSPPYFLAESFAGLYVLLAWWPRPFDAFTVRTAVKKELFEIEALTLMLPPPEGPDATSAAGKRRA